MLNKEVVGDNERISYALCLELCAYILVKVNNRSWKIVLGNSRLLQYLLAPSILCCLLLILLLLFSESRFSIQRALKVLVREIEMYVSFLVEQKFIPRVKCAGRRKRYGAGLDGSLQRNACQA